MLPPPKMLKQMGLEAEVDMDNVVDIDKVKPLFDVEILFKLMIWQFSIMRDKMTHVIISNGYF